MADDKEFDIKAFEKEIETWAKGVSQGARSAFASQCAARVLPNIGGLVRPTDFTGVSFDLSLIRATLTSAVAGTIPTADVKAAALSARSAHSVRSAHSAARSALSAAYSALSPPSALSAHSAARSAAYSARSALSAANSARSAAYSANSARSAHSAAELLNQSAPKALFDRPLWLDAPWPDEIANNWATLRGEWSTDPTMAFWIDWYEGLLAGRTPDWDLWHDIVLIDNEHWDAGPEAVAREIERIKEDLRDKRAEKFEDHVRSLVPRFKVLAPQADRLANLIEEALREFHNEVEVNRLPESIDPLCKLPPILRKIALEMAGTAPEDTKVENISKLVAAMSETITELNFRLERANNLAPRDRTLEQSRLKRFASSNGMSGWLVSSSLMFFSLMAGPAADETTKQTLNQTDEQICITDFPEDEKPKEIPDSMIEAPQELPNPTIDT